MLKTDTIAAIATALSNSGLSIIRVSGEDAVEVVDKIFYKKTGENILSGMKSHTVSYGYIFDGDVVIDEVIVLLMKAPRSYTKEDVVEINCHGGIVVTKKILDLLLKHGARAAEAGEFTKRAFLNGRIDLSQAEAVIDIIHAKNELALKNSIQQLRGTVLNKIKKIRELILRDIAFIEAALDDPEHISLEDFPKELLFRVIKEKQEIEELLLRADDGRIIKEGIQTVIVGKPNAGKSSIMNLLAGEERAIVTDIAGTTRDILEEAIQLKGICFNIIDTAGIRDSKDTVEKIGIEKAKKAALKADLIIYVVDSSVPLDENDAQIIKFIKDKKAIVLLNKSDLKSAVDEEEIKSITGKSVIRFSATEDMGIKQMEKEITDLFFSGDINFNDEIYITNLRHKAALYEAVQSLLKVEESIRMNMPEDFFSIDLMDCYEALGSIIGESVDEDLINMIFKEFCMGK